MATPTVQRSAASPSNCDHSTWVADWRIGRSTRLLAAPGVHLEMRVALQGGDRNQRLAGRCTETLLGAAVGAHRPHRRNQMRELFPRRPFTQRMAEIETAARVEAEQPQAVRGQAA